MSDEHIYSRNICTKTYDLENEIGFTGCISVISAQQVWTLNDCGSSTLWHSSEVLCESSWLHRLNSYLFLEHPFTNCSRCALFSRRAGTRRRVQILANPAIGSPLLSERTVVVLHLTLFHIHLTFHSQNWIPRLYIIRRTKYKHKWIISLLRFGYFFPSTSFKANQTGNFKLLFGPSKWCHCSRTE